MTTGNGEGEDSKGPLELNETLTIETHEGKWLRFGVVGILEDAENAVSYAVLRREISDGEEDEFIVTDLVGKIVEDEALAQEILDDFLAFTDDEDGRPARNGETL